MQSLPWVLLLCPCYPLWWLVIQVMITHNYKPQRVFDSASTMLHLLSFSASSQPQHKGWCTQAMDTRPMKRWRAIHHQYTASHVAYIQQHHSSTVPPLPIIISAAGMRFPHTVHPVCDL